MSVTAGLPYDDVVPYPQAQLDKILQKVKGRLFFMKGAGFLGSLLCDHRFVWDEDCPTAWCNGDTIGWNPKFFTWLTLDERVTVLAHELWHTGYGHVGTGRVGNRCPDYWNKAADYVINNSLESDGYVFGTKLKSLKPCLDHKFDDMSTEQIYDLLGPPPSGQPMPQPGQSGSGSSGQGQGQVDPDNPMAGDVRVDGSISDDKIIGKIIKAAQASRMAKEAGVVPGETELILNNFLNPILPWETLLRRFMTQLDRSDYSWKRPSRCYETEYLPSLEGDNGLEHIVYYLDVSGSVTDEDILRFNSEVSFIHRQLQPKQLTLVTFDTSLRDRYEFTDEMPFNEIVVHGRGGTSLTEVQEDIAKIRPSAAVIFSDLFCRKMTDNPGVPVLWVCVGNKKASVDFGQLIHIDNEK